MATGAVIVAAGRSERMGGLDKLQLPIAGKPVLWHSLTSFAQDPVVESLVVVSSRERLPGVRSIAQEAAPEAKVIIGGRRRRDSVRAGLEALGPCEYVIIHDAARPFVTAEMIDACLAGARLTGAALCAVPVPDTLKRAGKSGLVSGTVGREGMWLAQTPQAFRMDLLMRAHEASDIDATDDASLVELLGEPVRIVLGSPHNLKITVPEDMALAEALFATLNKEDA